MKAFLVSCLIGLIAAGQGCQDHDDCHLVGDGLRFCAVNKIFRTQFCSSCVLCSTDDRYESSVDGQCATACHSQASQALLTTGVESAVHPRNFLATLLVNDTTCEAIWDGQLPKRMNRLHTMTALRRPLGYNDWHPAYKSLSSLAYFNCLLISALEGGVPTDATHPFNVNYSTTHRQQTLPDGITLSALSTQAMMRAGQHVFTTAFSARRSPSAKQIEDFFSGLWSGLHGSTDELANELTGGVWDCVKDAGSVIEDLYNYYETKSTDWVSDVRDVAKTALDCINAGTNFSPVGWVKDVYDAFEIVFDATQIYSDCAPVYTDLTASEFKAYQTGQDTGRCIHEIAKAAGKRRRAAIPSAWTCDPRAYDDRKVCNEGCGVYDPDCSNGALPVRAALAKTGVPQCWDCSPWLYHDGLCNTGCGCADPDCAKANAQPGVAHGAMLFIVEGRKTFMTSLDNHHPEKNPELLTGTQLRAQIPSQPDHKADPSPSNPSTPASPSSSSLSGAGVVGIALGCVMVLMLAAVVVMARRSSAHLTANGLAEGLLDDDANA